MCELPETCIELLRQLDNAVLIECRTRLPVDACDEEVAAHPLDKLLLRQRTFAPDDGTTSATAQRANTLGNAAVKSGSISSLRRGAT